MVEHRPQGRRRLHPPELLRWFLEFPEEERLDAYWQRWRSFLCAVELHRAWLAREVTALAEAEARLVPGRAPPLDPGQGELRILSRAAAVVQRWWRSRPCAAQRGARLPPIATGPYFETSADAVHFLDLDPRFVTEALAQEPLGRHAPGPGPQRHRPTRGDERLLVDELREQLLNDPATAAAGPLFQPVIARLTALAHNGASQAARRVAADRLAGLIRAVSPDFRTRTHRLRPGRHRLRARSRERVERLASLAEAIREEQANFATYCAGCNQAALPPPLRTQFRFACGPR